MSQPIITTINRESILALINDAREEKGLTVLGLEQKAGVSRDTVRDFERGKAQLIRADKLQKVLNVLGYTLTMSRILTLKLSQALDAIRALRGERRSSMVNIS